MIGQLLLAGGAIVACVAIHASAMLVATRALYPWLRRKGENGNIVVMMISVVSCLSAFHFVEILVWALVMTLSGAVRGDDALYFAFVSYTTLGYGDVLPHETRELLGPASAMNGILLFGWSTAVIFHVMTGALHMKKAP